MTLTKEFYKGLNTTPQETMTFNIEKIDSKYWAIQHDGKTKRYVNSEMFDTKEEAEDKRDEYKRDYLNR